MNELQLASSRLWHLLEVGKTISAASRAKIVQAIATLQALLSEAGGQPLAESRRATALAEARALVEAEMSYSEREGEVRDALRAKFGGPPNSNTWVYLVDCFDIYAIYSVEIDGADSKTYQVSYTLLDGVVTLGVPVEVEKVVSYVPVTRQEAASVELVGEVIPLVEAKAVGKDGTAKVKIISPGVGTSGYYSPDVLKRDAAKFAGAQSFWDHPTATEEANRPERSLRDLAGKVVGTPAWQENGATGPGVYADVQVFQPYQAAVQELAPHIGMSIRALGKAKQGDVDGQRMPVIESIETVKSVDFVTQPGRGGEILQLFESARGRTPADNSARTTREEVSTVTEEEARVLREANAAATAEVARLREALLLREARDVCAEVLAGIQIPDLTRARLTEALAAKPALKDGALDRDAYKAQITESARLELEYLAKVSGRGEVKGLGSPAQQSATAALKESYLALYRAQGMAPEQAEKMATLAAG